MLASLRHLTPIEPASGSAHRTIPGAWGGGAGLVAAAASLVGGLAVVMRVLVP